VPRTLRLAPSGSARAASLHDCQTYTGPILISVNPWKRLNIYMPDTLEKYRGKYLTQMPPHVFAIAEFAYAPTLSAAQIQYPICPRLHTGPCLAPV
jgi:hypothetical protein